MGVRRGWTANRMHEKTGNGPAAGKPVKGLRFLPGGEEENIDLESEFDRTMDPK